MANQGEGDKPLTARENACDQIASALVWSDWFRKWREFYDLNKHEVRIIRLSRYWKSR